MDQLSLLHPDLIKRLNVTWRLPEDYIYYSLLARVFPVLNEFSAIPIDEFGPEMYRQKGTMAILIVLERLKEKNQTWILVVTSEWMLTHKRLTRPRWILEKDLKNYTRFARNELWLEVQRFPLI